LLVSGGAYYVNMTSDGKQLQLKEGKTMEVEFPQLTDEKMVLFYGGRDELERINWKEATQTFKPVPKTTHFTVVWDTREGTTEQQTDLKRELTKEERKKLEAEQRNANLKSKVYQAMSINKLGWINCDRFWNVEQKTNLHISLDEVPAKLVSANVYLVFKGIFSTMQEYWFADNPDNCRFAGIPLGSEVTVLAYSLVGEDIRACRTDFITEQDQTMPLKLQKMQPEEFGRLFQSFK
jgi:hypothetical protein